MKNTIKVSTDDKLKKTLKTVSFLPPTFGAGFGGGLENIFVGSKNHYFGSLSFPNDMENHLDPFCKCFEQKKSF